ncbi:molybdopterin-containing oxidoreductase family protein [Engelhardtia mirabilis]|uniref:Dimethyl sulfoxide reductase DmsA n=1 Tax=Engelhardtia mirabilis TaxID=2528011 RepID=A0A518BRG8_9BACT|nr:Dimethyl sulfoxide reductase DmsA precursor [Planctomycetes bacterium Pla133]QDV03879.1 Dimethyl sulfoxide reductase DmsA precursor [Planctomycetes bacterium Pla86]
MSDTSVRTVRTACPLDCPDSCSLVVDVAEGKLARIDAVPVGTPGSNPATQGFICGKVRRIGQHLYGPERLTTPLRRVGAKGEGRFEPISWNTALDLVAEGMRAVAQTHGPEAVLPLCYGGSNGLLTQDAADAILFRRFGAARLLRTVCAAPSSAAYQALYGRMPGVAYSDYDQAQLIVIWGANPKASGIHLVPAIDAALERGAHLVVVDPRRTGLAKKAHLHLALRPGTDLCLALALIRWMFHEGRADERFLAAHANGVDELRAAAEPWTLERAAGECGLSVDQVRAFAEVYCAARPAVLRVGWGQERNRNGGFATAAILALPAVAGHFGVRGGGFTASTSGAWGGLLDTAVDEPDRAQRVVNMNRLGRELLEPEGTPIHALFVYNANPLATLPDQERVRRGLAREDLLTIVFDAVATDTARFADIVLPATTFLEHLDLHKSYGTLALQRVNPAVDAHGEARCNHEVFLDIAERLGLVTEGKRPSLLDLESRVVAPLRKAGVDTAALELDGYVTAPGGYAPIPFVDVFPRTPDDRIDLAPAQLAAEAPVGLYGYRPDPASEAFPLALISPALARTTSSTFAQLIEGQVALTLHPDDAAARGLEAGGAVRVFNELGEVHCELGLDPDLRPGVACLPKGLWERHTTNGNTSNALCPDTLTDLGGGACFNDARVQVENLPARAGGK